LINGEGQAESQVPSHNANSFAAQGNLQVGRPLTVSRTKGESQVAAQVPSHKVTELAHSSPQDKTPETVEGWRGALQVV